MDMGRMADMSSVWPSTTYRAVMATLYIAAVSVLSVFMNRRMPDSWESLKATSLARNLVLVVLIESWIFIFASMVILFGIGSSMSGAACSTGILLCIFVYATSKMIIYLFLMERCHLVYGQTVAGRVSRLKSPWYRVAAFFMVMWIGVAVVMLVGRISYIREHDGACVIGLKLYSTVPMLTVDVIVNVFLTTAFVIPIWKSKFPKARKLALNSCIAAVAALVTSFVNICILTIHNGKQLSFVCLGSCGLDVTLNAAIIFFVTSGDRGKSEDRTSLSIGHNARRPSNFGVVQSTSKVGVQGAGSSTPLNMGGRGSSLSVTGHTVSFSNLTEDLEYLSGGSRAEKKFSFTARDERSRHQQGDGTDSSDLEEDLDEKVMPQTLDRDERRRSPQPPPRLQTRQSSEDLRRGMAL